MMFDRPFEDVDEWRDTPAPHRYLHGGFAATDTRFSLYLPPERVYEGRFFQHITPVPDSEHLAQQHVGGPEDKIGFALSSGAYFLETNGGGSSPVGPGAGDTTVTAFRANAAAAEHSRALAASMYGPHRPFGYAYGGSGGAYRTIGSMQNTDGVWDGVVPYVMGSPMAIPNVFTVRMQAMRVLRDVFDGIVDAVEPGGGDMYAGLDEVERAALEEVTRMGFPPQSWFGHATMGQHGFTALYGGIRMADPSYFEEFWTTPGYLGHDAPSSLERDRVRHATTVVAPVTGAEADPPGGRRAGEARGGVDSAFQETRPRPAAFRLASTPDLDVESADLTVHSGDAAGASFVVRDVVDDVVWVDPSAGEVLDRIQPGDDVEFDNADILAVQSYHRHQDPGPEYPVWDQFRSPAGEPRHPQRPMLLGPLFTEATAGAVPTGEVKGRMILVGALWDREAFPWQCDWYRDRVREAVGEEIDDRFRLWFVDRALHGDDEEQEDPTRTVSYLGVLHQALRALAAWVEHDVAPPESTHYEVVDGQVVVPASAADRKGVQPVVSLSANGAERAEVGVGEPVGLAAVAEVPPGVGTIVDAEWVFTATDGAAALLRSTDEERVALETTHAFVEPGTYFPVLRVTSQHQGDPDTPFGRVHGLGRVRVVVGTGSAP